MDQTVKEEVERLDKAFEWVVLFIGISYATIIQLATWVWESPTPSQTSIVVSSLLSVVRFTYIPLLIIILLWLGKFVAAEPRKMFFRKAAWSWAMLELAIHIISSLILVTIDLPRDSIYLKTVIFPCFVIVPAITFIVYWKVMSSYKKATPESPFWRNKWNYGTTAVAILSMVLFFVFVYSLPHTWP